jgi:hypothetical protein
MIDFLKVAPVRPFAHQVLDATRIFNEPLQLLRKEHTDLGS